MIRQLIRGLYPYLIIAVLGYALWDSVNRSKRYHQLAQSLEATVTDLNQEIKYTQLRLNDSISVYQAEVRALRMTEKNIQARYDRLLSASKIKPKDVDKVTEVTTVIQSVDTVKADSDSFGTIKAQLRDSFVKIDVEVFKDLSTIIDYEIRDSLTILDVQKKHSWLFGLIKWKEHRGIRVINHNPKATIVSLQTIEVIDDK